MVPRATDEQLSFARRLRSRTTGAEAVLWRSLRDRRVGAKFRRQHVIGPYVADTACIAARLVIELDGPVHPAEQRRVRDRTRDAWLFERGWTVLRFASDAVIGGGDIVVDRIRAALSSSSPHPALAHATATFSREAGEGSSS